MPTRDAVLMLGFGGPTCPDEVRPFVEKVVAGRGVRPERVDEVCRQYAAIGGKSPFVELTLSQAVALEKALLDAECPMPVRLGTLYSKPSIEEAVSNIVTTAERIIGVVMAPHKTEASYDRYRSGLDLALSAIAVGRPTTEFIDGWHTHPLFIAAIASRIEECLKLSKCRLGDALRLVFTAHSVPVEMSKRSNYAKQIEETAAAVANRLDCSDYVVAYQSRSGSPTQAWLEPDVRDAISNAALEKKLQVVVMPIGFLCDHVEILYDLDLQAKEVARENGISMWRASTVGDHPDFIKMLAQLVKAKAAGCRE